MCAEENEKSPHGNFSLCLLLFDTSLNSKERDEI